MNAGGVDEACKSNGLRFIFGPMADEVGTRRYVPQSQG